MIVQTIDFYQFREAFIRMERIDTYSREGLELLFDYLVFRLWNCHSQIAKG